MKKLYSLEESVELIGTTPEALRTQVYLGRLKAYRKEGQIYLGEDALKTYCEKIFGKVGRPTITEADRVENFDAMHGKGSYEKLLSLFQK